MHVVTIEDPIEVLHEDKLAMINQREVGSGHRPGSSTALRAAMRQDPDVILVGEMRDEETVRAALAAAETGHFVMSTLHTTDAQETVNRIIDFFPPHEQQQVRVSLAGALRGIVASGWSTRADGLGRCCVAEICVDTGPDRRGDRRPGEDEPDHASWSREGGYYGMQTFDQHLVALVRDGVVTVEAASAVASKPHDLTVELRRLGPRRLNRGRSQEATVDAGRADASRVPSEPAFSQEWSRRSRLSAPNRGASAAMENEQGNEEDRCHASIVGLRRARAPWAGPPGVGPAASPKGARPA